MVYDAEHFFDSRTAIPFLLRTLEAAKDSGADVLCLWIQIARRLPMRLVEVLEDVRKRFDGILGIHPHNDSELAVANALVAVEAGVTHAGALLTAMASAAGMPTSASSWQLMNWPRRWRGCRSTTITILRRTRQSAVAG